MKIIPVYKLNEILFSFRFRAFSWLLPHRLDGALFFMKNLPLTLSKSRGDLLLKEPSLNLFLRIIASRHAASVEIMPGHQGLVLAIH